MKRRLGLASPRTRRFFLFFLTLLSLTMVLCSALAESAESEAVEEAENLSDQEIAVETASASGSRLSAEEVVVNGKTAGIKSLRVFSGAQGRILVPTAGKTGYSYVYAGDGARTVAWKITSATGSLHALMRIGATHHAAVRVTARQTSWAASRPDEEVYLWINAYGSKTPGIVPVSTAPRIVEHGEAVAFETGIPGATVELYSGDGELITTAPADETGLVVFDSQHAADGTDHWTSEIRSYGLHDYHEATAFASNPANLLPAGGGTAIEWASGNDCATYQSQTLTQAGFPVYTPYTNSTSSPGGSLRHVLTDLIGSDAFKTTFTIADFHEGDIVWGHSMGHVMYCARTDPAEDRIYVYGHSASAGGQLTDNGWVPISLIDAVMQMVTEESFDYEYRVNGVADPRLVKFESLPDDTPETQIVQAGTTMVLPDNPFTAPVNRSFAGWLLNGECHAPGEEITVSDHMTFTALWLDSTLLGEADLVLPASLTRIEDCAFSGIAAESVYICDGCESIGTQAFSDCANLRWIRIPAGCEVDDTAFEHCGEITVFGTPGSDAERFCEAHEGFRFEAEQAANSP